jgi:putative endopeptidase
LNIWKNKIRFTILHEISIYLNKDFVQACFHMFDHLIYGQREDKTHWMKIIEEINKHLGELLGELFISRYFHFNLKDVQLIKWKSYNNVYINRASYFDSI